MKHLSYLLVLLCLLCLLACDSPAESQVKYEAKVAHLTNKLNTLGYKNVRFILNGDNSQCPMENKYMWMSAYHFTADNEKGATVSALLCCTSGDERCAIWF